MDIIECLMKVGFTRHEAVLYITLCREGELTGYEAAKISGIPRSNAYLALAGLVEKGGAFRIEGDSVRYTAVHARELVFNLRKELDKTLYYIEKNAPEKEESAEPYITITGKSHVLNKMRYMISHARERIYLSMSHSELEYVKTQILEARDKGLKVVIITSAPYEIENVVVFYNEKQPGQIRLITDTSHVLTGEISEEGESTCLYSKNKNLIHLIKDSLTNEIKLIEIRKVD